jgi:hypothetical protein
MHKASGYRSSYFPAWAATPWSLRRVGPTWLASGPNSFLGLVIGDEASLQKMPQSANTRSNPRRAKPDLGSVARLDP